jgi:hypothetical protein
MAERVVIAELDINVEAFIKNTSQIKKQIDQLKKDQKELATIQGGTASKAFVQNAADLKVLSQAYGANIKALAENTKATSDGIARQQLLNNVLLEEVNSIKEARDQNKLLNKLRNETNVSTEQGKKELEALNGALDSNNAFIKENADAYLKQKIGIGGYQEAIENALGGVKVFGVGLNDLKSNFNQFKGILVTAKNDIVGTASEIKNTKDATDGLSGAQKASFITLNALTKGLRIFKLALIGTGIGAIVVAFGSLITFLATTQKGIDAVTSITRPLTAVFDVLLGTIQEFGEAIFDDPLKGLKDIFNFVKNQLVVSFNGLGKIIQGVFTLDRSKIEEGANQIKKLADDNAKAIKEGIDGIGNQFSEAIKIGKELDRLEKQLERTRINNTIELGKQTEEVKAQNLIAEDQTKTLAEREQATIRSIEAAGRINELKQEELDLEIKILENRQSRNDTSREEEQELANLLAAKNELNAQELELVTTQTNKLNTIRRDSANKAKEIADKAIADQNDQLQLFIAQQGTRANTLSQQLELDQQIADKRLAILKSELQNRNITQTQFDTELLNIQNDLAQARAEAVIEQAESELESFISKNQSKIDSEQFFSDESLRIEQERIDALAQKQLEFEAKRLDQGVISQTEFNQAVNDINEENRLANEEAQNLRDEAQTEADVINLENQRILDQQNFETRLEADLANLEIRKEAELAIARSKGADEQLIKDKYTNASIQIEQAAADAKLQANAALFGDIAGLLGKESALGKVAALAQAGINIQQGITKAIAQGGIAGIATGAIVAAKGAISISKIAGVNTKFEKGGISSIDGNSHAQGGVPIFAGNKYIGEAEGDEGIGILNRGAYASFMDFNNRFGSGNSRAGFYEGGAIITQTIPTADGSNAEILRAIQSMPAPIVTVQDIQRENSSYVQVANGANV